MYKGSLVAVVMPIHNEEAQLRRAIDRIPAYVDAIVAVDDGSSDGTWQELCRIENPKLLRLRHERNRGVGAAAKTGYAFALRTNVDFIAVMDGDGQMDGRDLWRLLERAARGADYVKGNRFLNTSSIDRMPATRYIGNRVFSWLTRRVAGFSSSLDAQCGYTVIRRTALMRLNLEGLYDRYGFLNEMFFAASRAGLTIRSVPVRTVYGDEVSGINPFTAIPTILFLIGRGYLRGRVRPGLRRFILSARQAERADRSASILEES